MVQVSQRNNTFMSNHTPFLKSFDMNIFRSALLSFVCMGLGGFTALSVYAQTADDIIAKHVGAMGGKDKLLTVHSLYIEGTAVTSTGTEVNTKTWRVQGKLYRQEIDFGMGTIVIIVTPTQGWASNPRTGGEFKALPDEQLKALQTQMDPADPLVDYAAKGNKVELAGKDTVDNNECIRIKLTYATGQYAVFSIDEKTFFIVRETRKGGGMMGGGGGAGNGGGRRPGGAGDGEMRIDFNDFKPTPNGFMFPYTIIAGGFGARSSVTKLEINGSVDVAALSKPK
jgi:hypothetical protein